MEVALEVEDDVFFADLSKQISLLIMDDEEDPATSHRPSLSLQVFSEAIRPPITQTPSISYEPTYFRRSSESCKGTGVFIPRLSQPRRKNRQGRNYNSSNTKFRKQVDNSRGLQHVPFNNNSSYDSFDHRS